MHTFSSLQMYSSRLKISASEGFMKRRMAHLLWMGSIISEELLQARANLVVAEYNSMVRRMACCAAEVILPNVRQSFIEVFSVHE
jgi:hypothetical protein